MNIKVTSLLVLAILLSSCRKNPSEDVLTYTRQLKPNMTIEDVKKLFPEKMHWFDEPADETKENCWMERRYSTNTVAHRLVFHEPDAGSRVTTVYFDSNKILIGLDFKASSGSRLGKDELRFPGDLIQCRWKTLHWHKKQEEYQKCQEEWEKWMKSKENKKSQPSASSNGVSAVPEP